MLPLQTSTVITIGSPEFDRGNWNANTNTPTLADNGGGGVVGDFYTVSVAGATSLDGVTDWKISDLVKNVDSTGGKKWIKFDQTPPEIASGVSVSAVSVELARPTQNWNALSPSPAFGFAAVNAGVLTVAGSNVHTGIIAGATYQLAWELDWSCFATTAPFTGEIMALLGQGPAPTQGTVVGATLNGFTVLSTLPARRGMNNYYGEAIGFSQGFSGVTAFTASAGQATNGVCLTATIKRLYGAGLFIRTLRSFLIRTS